MYNDAYPTCATTYVTLCVYGVDPVEVTRALRIQPTDSFRRGDARPGRATPHDAWFLGSKQAVESKDVRRHLDWVLDQLADRRDALRELVGAGARITASCYWLSASGHGGPSVSSVQAKKLAELDLELQFDVYFGRET